MESFAISESTYEITLACSSVAITKEVSNESNIEFVWFGFMECVY